MKKVYVSENVIDNRAKTRLMKIEECGTTTLYIAQSKADAMETVTYSVLTPVNRPEMKITTPIMKMDGHNKVEQMCRGIWIGDIDVGGMEYDDVTYFHPTSLQDFINLLSMTRWFADDFDEPAINADNETENGDIIVNVKVESRSIKSVNYLMKYEADISMYKVYRIEKINF